MYLDRPDNKPETREDMIAYLKNHFRYHTMNSWNASTSYAHCIKINRVNGLTKEDRDACYDMLDLEEALDEMHMAMCGFKINHDGWWSIGSNGRSGGYLVLYAGGTDDKGHKHIYPGKSVDMYEDFNSWDNEALSNRVEVVWEFDLTCEDAVHAFIEFAKSHKVVEKEVLVPKTVRVAEERTQCH